MTDATIVHLGQMVVSIVCLLSGASVAKAAVNGGKWWHVVAGIAVSLVFVYAAIALANTNFYMYST